MALFEVALAVVLTHEGGFVFDPLDAGKATNMGITQATLSSYLGRQATVEDVQTLRRDVAASIYKKMYWTRILGDAIADNAVATSFLDMAVLMGPAQATKLVQTTLGVVSDGLMGPKTLAAINACPRAAFTSAFARVCVKMFVDLVVAKPNQLKFLPGWVTRADQMVVDKLV